MILVRGESFPLVLSLRCMLYICCPDVGTGEGHENWSRKISTKVSKCIMIDQEKTIFQEIFGKNAVPGREGAILFCPQRKFALSTIKQFSRAPNR